MKIRFLALLTCMTVAIAFLPRTSADVSPCLRVHLLSGSAEYDSDHSLELWTAHLRDDYGIASAISRAPDKAESVEGLDRLSQADVLVIFCRRWQLPADQAAFILDWIRSGKPILAIRTASHAFQFFKEFDHEILGGDYSGHGQGCLPIQVVLNPDQHSHPVLAGIREWERIGKLYRNPNLAPEVTVLLSSVSPDPAQPLAWVRLNGNQRVFYTSMGLPADFENPAFIRLLDNALFWAAGSGQAD